MSAADGQQTQSGRVREVEEIFCEHYDFLFAAARKILRRATDAEDVIQNLFLKLVQYELPPEIRKDPKAYLHRAAVNTSYDLIRSRKSRKETEGVEKLEMTEPRTGRVNENVGDKLEGLLGSLQEDVAQIVLLHSQHGYSDTEIATMMGESRSKIASILSRARGKLRKMRDDRKEKYART